MEKLFTVSIKYKCIIGLVYERTIPYISKCSSCSRTKNKKKNQNFNFPYVYQMNSHLPYSPLVRSKNINENAVTASKFSYSLK